MEWEGPGELIKVVVFYHKHEYLIFYCISELVNGHAIILVHVS